MTPLPASSSIRLASTVAKPVYPSPSIRLVSTVAKPVHLISPALPYSMSIFQQASIVA